ncbi:hypothetical protein EXT68_22160 [Pectobacterium parmentieri]|nr:hypothetical protein [Pectobacterium parmentieri]MCL6382784.1 hypothetical protein [Pectobacterium parmentieri]
MSKSKDPLAIALSLAYDRAMKARQAVEHRLASIPPQERIVERWFNDTATIATEEYSGWNIQSYPVQTRIQNECNKLSRYKDEIDDRLTKYAEALKDLEQVKKKILSVKTRASSPEIESVLKSCPKVLRYNPWPDDWPRQIKVHCHKMPFHAAYFFKKNIILPAPPEPSLTPFHMNLAGYEIELFASYQNGIPIFKDQLSAFLYDPEFSSRWPAILEAIRCGIRWPLLDRYLEEAGEPWLPRAFVAQEFGLRGSLYRRDQLADVMNQVSQEAAHWYLTQHTGSTILYEDFVDTDIIEELMSIGLIKWGPEMPARELLRYIPFTEVRSLFALADLIPPRGFDAAVAKFNELIEAYGKDEIEYKIKCLIDVSRIIDVLEINGWEREERLGVRARANVLVSTLVMLDEGDPGPLCIIKWNPHGNY